MTPDGKQLAVLSDTLYSITLNYISKLNNVHWLNSYTSAAIATS